MLTRPFITLSIAIFAATMGIGMVAPVLPVHARSLGATGPQVALTFSAFALTQVVISPFAGRLADRSGRKPLIVLGTITYVIAALGWFFTDDINTAIALRALTGVGSGLVFSLAGAYIGDLTPDGHEGRYMGVFGLFDFMGFGVGPVVSGIVRDRYDFDAVFLSMAGLMVVATLLIAVLLPAKVSAPGRGKRGEVGAASSEGEPATARPGPAPWPVVLRDPMMQGVFALRLGFALAFGAAFSFLAIHLEQELGATATMVGFVLAGQELTGGLLQPLFGPVADRYDRRAMVVFGMALASVGYITLAMSSSYAVILTMFIVGAGGGAAIQGVAGRAVEVDIGRRLGMATTMSLGSMAFALGVLIGSIGGGVLADGGSLGPLSVDGLGVRSVFIAAAASLLAGGIIFALRAGGRTLAAPRGAEATRGRGEAAGGS